MINRYNFYNFEATFKQFLIAGNFKPITIKNYLSDLRHFFGWLILKLKVIKPDLDSSLVNEIEILKEINPQLIAEYKKYLTSNNLPIRTIKRRLSTLRTFFTFCINQNWLESNPAKNTQKNLIDLFKNALEKEKLDQKTVKSCLDDVQEFLSII